MGLVRIPITRISLEKPETIENILVNPSEVKLVEPFDLGGLSRSRIFVRDCDLSFYSTKTVDELEGILNEKALDWDPEMFKDPEAGK